MTPAVPCRPVASGDHGGRAAPAARGGPTPFQPPRRARADPRPPGAGVLTNSPLAARDTVADRALGILVDSHQFHPSLPASRSLASKPRGLPASRPAGLPA